MPLVNRASSRASSCRTSSWLLLAASALFGGACSSSPTPTPPAPTLATLHFSATGFFRIEHPAGGRYWLVDPAGNPFYSTGVSVITAAGDTAPSLGRSPYHDNILATYGSADAWATATSKRLHDWNVNTVGAWSDYDRFASEFAYTPIVNCANADWQTGKVPDYFSAAFRATADQQSAIATAGRVADKNLLGYFLDNELQWGNDQRNLKSLLDQYMALPAAAEGKVALISLLKSRYADIAAFNAVWGGTFQTFDEVSNATTLPVPANRVAADADRSAFLTSAAHEYFAACSTSLRAHDPNHLLLGVRFFVVATHPEVLQEAALTQDVLSVNFYEFQDWFYEVASGFGGTVLPVDNWLTPFHDLADKPYLLSEWSYLAKDSGLPNSHEGIYVVVPTEADKAARIAAYADHAARTDYVVGYHYFQYFDQPAEGRFDGENNNFGLVHIDDSPYLQVTAALTSANAAAAPSHFAGAAP